MKKTTTLCLSLLIAMTAAAEEWTLVRDASSLQAGDQLVLAYADAANSKYVTATTTLTKTNSASYMEPVASTFSDDLSQLTTLGANTAVFLLGGEPEAWTLSVEGASGYVKLGATALKKLAWSGTDTWKISITDGVAQIASTNAEYGRIQYNYNNGNPRFCNYAGTMKDVSVYRLYVPPTYTLAYEGYPYLRTMCGLPAYKAGTAVQLSTGAPSKEGDEFLGWQYGETTYQPGATFTMPEEDVVLKALWKSEATGVKHVVEAPKATKQIRDGQLIIVRDGMEFNVLGVRVK